jgi:hypothetical protein
MKYKNIKINDSFSNLIIRELEFKNVNNKSFLSAYCECVCGNFKWIRVSNLVRNHTKSCGCILYISKIENYKEISGVWFALCRRRAKYRKIPFNITPEDVWSVWEKQNFRCALTGESLVWPYRISGVWYGDASIDRVDSKKPYDIDNIQIVHKDVNFIKLDHIQEKFIDICRRVAAFSPENQKEKPIPIREMSTGRSELRCD